MFPYIDALGFRPEQSKAEADAILDHIFGPDGEETRQALLNGLDLMNGQFNAHGVEMGQRYRSGAVVDDGTPFPAYDRDPELYYQPTTHPGSPVPHVWLERDQRPISTLDLCGYDRFTLLTGIGGEAWHQAAQEVAGSTGVPIEAVTIGLGQINNDVYGNWMKRREIGDRGCLLVRPDRVVAWRSHDMAADPTGDLDAAMRHVLAHPA
jgi:2,4-dichlorophenol 6-monooxygenase